MILAVLTTPTFLPWPAAQSARELSSLACLLSQWPRLARPSIPSKRPDDA